MRGRFTEIDEDNKKENVTVYGRQKVFYDIDGIDLLKKASKMPDEYNLAAEKILDDSDLRKIKYLKMKKALQKIDKKRFRDSGSEGEQNDEEEKDEDEEEDEEYDSEGEGEEEEGADDEGEEEEEEELEEEEEELDEEEEEELEEEESEEEEEKPVVDKKKVILKDKGAKG